MRGESCELFRGRVHAVNKQTFLNLFRFRSINVDYFLRSMLHICTMYSVHSSRNPKSLII